MDTFLKLKTIFYYLHKELKLKANHAKSNHRINKSQASVSPTIKQASKCGANQQSSSVIECFLECFPKAQIFSIARRKRVNDGAIWFHTESNRKDYKENGQQLYSNCSCSFTLRRPQIRISPSMISSTIGIRIRGIFWFKKCSKKISAGVNCSFTDAKSFVTLSLGWKLFNVYLIAAFVYLILDKISR